jgi:hypothetical protein
LAPLNRPRSVNDWWKEPLFDQSCYSRQVHSSFLKRSALVLNGFQAPTRLPSPAELFPPKNDTKIQNKPLSQK